MLKEKDDEGKLKEMMTRELTGFTQTLLESVQQMKNQVMEEQESLDMRMTRLEERIKEHLSIPVSPTLDEKRILSLHNAGYSKEEIARELRANVSEVGFVLKLNNLI